MIFAQHTQPVLLFDLFKLKTDNLTHNFIFYGLVLIYFYNYSSYLLNSEQSHTVPHL